MSKQRGRRVWLTLVVLVSCVLIGTVLLAIGVMPGFARTAPLEIQTYSATRPQQARLDIQLDAGNVRIHRGNVQGVSIAGTKYFSLFGSENDVGLHMTWSDDTLHITQESAERPIHLGWTGVALDITVPAMVNINLTMRAGQIELDNIHGQVRVKTGADSITVHDSELTDGSVLDAGAGTLIATNTHLHGNVSLKSDTGMVAFSGDVDPQGTYAFHSEGGSISVALPDTASFIVDQLHSGIDTVANEFESKRVGAGPYAHVEIISNAGSIRLRRSEV